MCYGFPCGFWNDRAETCSKPLWEDCPEQLAWDMPPDDEDEEERAEAVMDFLRDLLERERQARQARQAQQEGGPCVD